MKTLHSFRLHSNVLLLIDQLTQKLHLTKTAVLERAIKSFASENLKEKSPLLQFAGLLPEKEASRMLKKIKSSKNSKKTIPSL